MSRRRRYRPRWAAWACIAAAFGCSFGAVIGRGGAVEWFLLIMLASVAAISLLLPIAAVRGVAVTRTMPEGQAAAGETGAIGITLTRRSRLPLSWLSVEDTWRNESSLEEKEISLRAVFAPLFAKEMSAQFDAKGLTRGVYRFRTVTVTCGDPFGLTSVRRELLLDGELAVTPAMPLLDRFEEPAATSLLGRRSIEAAESSSAGPLAEPNDRSDAFLTRNAGIGPDTRRYADGDSFRHVDFRAMARGRGLHTKVYPGAPRMELYAAIDQLAAPYGGDDVLFDACIGRMMVDAVRAASENLSVTMFAGEWSFELAGRPGRELASRIGELNGLLARLKPAYEPYDFWTGLEGAGSAALRGRTLRMYSADWQNASRWFELADRIGVQGFRLELRLFTRRGVLSFAMRELARQLDSRGIRVKWLQAAPYKGTAAGEGVSAHAMG